MWKYDKDKEPEDRYRSVLKKPVRRKSSGAIHGAMIEANKTSNGKIDDSLDAEFGTKVHRRKFKEGNTFIGFVLALCLWTVPVHAYTTVILSTGTPESVEQALLVQIANQFNASLFTNPLASNTYQIKLFGLNPNYVTAPGLITLDTLANKLTAISSQTVVTGFASGMLYERNNDAGMIGYYMGLCDNATNFSLVTIDSTTCQGVLGFMSNWIVFQTSGIAVVPNPPPGL